MIKKTEFVKAISSGVAKATMKIKKHSPEICIIVGIVGTVASAVVACKATTKVNKIIEETKTNVEKVHTATEKGVTEAGENYSEEDSKKDLTIIYIQTGVKFVKLYAPAVIMGLLSITSILASNNILRKRSIALSAAYATIDTSFKEYRKRVVERFGEQVDTELRYNIKAKAIDCVEVDPETGEKKTIQKTAIVADSNLSSDYAFYFDSKSKDYDKNIDYNRTFLNAQEKFANDKLSINGFIFLNEILDDIGMPRIPAGQIVGWTSKGPDGYVSFRIKEVERDTGNGYTENVLVIDPNVEGNILDKM